MKKTALFTLALLFTSATYAQRKIKGNGNVVTIERNTDDYDGIQVGGFYEVELVEGIEGEIRLTGEDNILEYIKTEVKGGILTIRSKKNMSLKPSQGEKIRIAVPVEKIDAIRLSGSGKLVAKKTLKADRLKIHTSGSRNAELNLDANSIVVISSGSSNITLDGTTEDINITSSGSSHLYAYELATNTADIRSSGSANIRLTVNEKIDSKSSGSSKVRYRGNPTKIHSKESGSSKVSKE